MSARLDQARQWMAQGRFDQARTVLAPLVARHGDDLDSAGALVECLIALHDWPAAQFQIDRLRRKLPAEPGPFTLEAQLALARGDARAAEAAARAAIERDESNPELHRHLAIVLGRDNQFVAQRDAARVGLRRAPDDADLLHKHAVATLNLGRSAEAVGLYRDAIERAPSALALREGLALAMLYAEGVSREDLATAHREYGRRVAEAANASGLPRPPRRTRAAGEPLRLGLLSADLRRHSVAFFVRPLLEHAADAGLECWCYSTATQEDDESARLRGLVGAARWRHWPAAAPAAIARGIRADGVDVLLDLGGLTVGSNPVALCLRSAPVQLGYCGYPHATGLPTLDGRLVDALTDPPEFDGAVGLEPARRLPRCFLSYAPPDDAPDPAPRTSGAPFTFGSFNVLRKLSDATLALWASALKHRPDARLLIKAGGLQHPAVADDLRTRFASVGVTRDRLDLRGPTPDLRAHLHTYHEVDIALDTFPYHGTTTTCEALWMGVPVLSRAGLHHAARVGLSLLTAAGRPQWCAADDDAWLRTLAACVADEPGRAAWRLSARGTLSTGPLLDGLGLAKSLVGVVAETDSHFGALSAPEKSS